MATISIEGVVKSYTNGYVALKKIDLRIGSGELVVLVGPSGCGKSTLLRTVAGLEEPTSGRVIIDGRDVTDDPPGDRGIAMVFQDYALYPHMTVKENLSFGLKLRKLAKREIERRITETSAMLGIGAYLSRRPAELSGGQRQRVAIGRAIVKQPRVFLFDEPLSNLDAQLRLRMRTEIGALHRRLGATTIYVTHDQAEAMSLAERLVVMNAGVIVQQGAPLDIYHRPHNRFVASFIGSPEMNLLEVEYVGAEKERLFFGYRSEVLALPLSAAPRMRGKAWLGFRPESLVLARNSASATFTARAVRVELHGHETHLIADLGGASIVMRSSDPKDMSQLERLKPDHPVSLEIKSGDVHWFDTSGNRLVRLNAKPVTGTDLALQRGRGQAIQ